MVFGEDAPAIQKLYLAVCDAGKESTSRKIFEHNLNKKIAEFVRAHGMRPDEREVNQKI